MGRIGVLLDNEPDFFDELTRSNHCHWEGLYSHFSTSDESDKDYADLQLKRFRKILSDIKKNSIQPSMIHMANSGAILDIPESYFDAVRPGVTLYGHYPSTETSQSIGLKQVMTLKTSVAHIRKIPAGFLARICSNTASCKLRQTMGSRNSDNHRCSTYRICRRRTASPNKHRRGSH